MMYPNPVILVSCGQGQEASIITLAWAGTVCGDPWMVAIGVRPATHSHGLLMKYREFVVNVPTVQQMRAVEICGSRSGRDCDKWAEAGLHPDESQEIKTPGIAECPISMECRVRHTLGLGLHTLFVAEVVKTRRDPAWNYDPPVPVYVEGKYHTMSVEAMR
jgi:flavin reductase (DIM6/NTAB) family NADH-FMN oxidoreductase RutF